MDTPFLVKIRDDSMTPALFPGEELLADPGALLEELGLCYDAGQKIVRRYHLEGDIVILLADNPAFEDIIIRPGEPAELYRIFRTHQKR